MARGGKTILREFERADVDRWVAWPPHADPLFENYNPPRLNERQRDLYFQQRRATPDARHYSVDDLSGDLVGRISLRDIDWRLRTAVLGVSFCPGRLNQGLGSDALSSFCRFFFTSLEMTILYLDVAAFNRRAFRVYQKCGFQHVGQRWGDPQVDPVGLFTRPEYEGLRELFRWDYGLIRPLLYDMELRRDEWSRSQQTNRQPACDRMTARAGC